MKECDIELGMKVVIRKSFCDFKEGSKGIVVGKHDVCVKSYLIYCIDKEIDGHDGDGFDLTESIEFKHDCNCYWFNSSDFDLFEEVIKSDSVNHPSHYTDGKIEVIEFIEDKNLDYHLGNAIKYISRAGKKDPSKEIEDLKKAEWYVKRKIKLLESENLGNLHKGEQSRNDI